MYPMMNQTIRLGHSCTNESLNAIVLGLNLSPEDSVLAVAGSGDQAFAILEFVRQVKAVDIAPEQIEFMRQRAEALRVGDYAEFLRSDVRGSRDNLLAANYPEFTEFNSAEFNLNRRRKYFAEDDKKRLGRIQGNLGNLVISEPANILEVAQTETGFSKIYLSNVFEYGKHGPSRRDILMKQVLGNIARNMPLDGLIYVANHLDEDKDLKCDSFLPPELKVDGDLSSRARRYEESIWKPAVYKRVEPKPPLTF